MIYPAIQSWIENHPLYHRLPLIREVLQQKWAHSHYIHGNVAYDAGIISGKSEEESISVAAALEFVWAGILVYDDILDGDEVRYHIASAWKKAGYARAVSESFEAMIAGPIIILDSHTSQQLHRDIHHTIGAMHAINDLSLTASLDEMTPAYMQLGALSVFACTWPSDATYARNAAQYETLAGQLVNDCNDCFGKKARRRGYSDLRNKQTTLLIGLLNSIYQRSEFNALIRDASESDVANIASQIHSCIALDPDPLFRVFHQWFEKALVDTNIAQNDEYSAWISHRVQTNFANWNQKLHTLINDTHHS